MGKMSENFGVLQAEVQEWCLLDTSRCFFVVILKNKQTLLSCFPGQMNLY